jgi:hypothetical protein
MVSMATVLWRVGAENLQYGRVYLVLKRSGAGVVVFGLAVPKFFQKSLAAPEFLDPSVDLRFGIKMFDFSEARR